jgi:hypothetical protein
MPGRKRTAGFAVICLAWGSLAAGQVLMEPFEQTGTIANGNAQTLVLTVLGTQTAVQIDSKDFANTQTSLELTAKAKNSVLAVGSFVRFSAKLDPKGKRILEPITKISVFSPTAETRLGAFAEDLAPAPLGAALDGVAPPVAAPPQPAAAGEALVVGRISRARKGEIGVQLPDRTLEAKLAPDCAIDVHFTDKATVLATLKPGDSVHVTGVRSPEGKIYASKITANLQRELGEDLKTMRPSRPPVVAGGGQKPAAPEGEAAAKADGDAINPAEDFGVAAADAEAEAAEKAERDAKPRRARILKVN